MEEVVIDEDSDICVVIITTMSALLNAYYNQRALYGTILQFDFTHGLISTDHQVGFGTTHDVQQHGHLIFGCLCNVAGCDTRIMVKIFTKLKYIVEQAVRAHIQDPHWVWSNQFGMADGADEIGNAMVEVFGEQCTRLMCSRHNHQATLA